MPFWNSSRRKTRNAKKVVAIAVAGVTVIVGAGVATAAFNNLKGSDTLFDVTNQAITLSGAAVTYLGTGSGNGETALLNHQQGIAPMSRNLKAAIIGPVAAGQPAPTHPSWAPTQANVVGLDAATIVQHRHAGNCPNIEELTTIGSNVATHYVRLALAGVDGTGSAAACSHPDRVAAIQALTDCVGAGTDLEHFYRRDDNSGTTNTMQEKLTITGFCNGTAVGTNVSNPNPNLNNQDNDPIRRPCVPTDSLHAVTPCRTSDNTQGFVVALSQPDPGLTDITVSIGRRVSLGGTAHPFLAYAGREAAKSSFAPAATKINIDGVTPLNDTNVRLNVYELSRRLFVQVGDLNDPNVVALDPTGEQAKLLAWMTGIGQDNYPALCTDAEGDQICGRPNMDPVMRQFGFISCLDDPFDTPAPPNLCGITPPPAPTVVTTPAGAVGALCTTNTNCANGNCVGGVCEPGTGDGGVCKVDSDCASGVCDTSGSTPLCLSPVDQGLALTYTTDVQPIYAAHCAPCHTTGSSGGVHFGRVGSYTDTQITPPSAAAIAAGCNSSNDVGACTLVRIQNGTMPPPAGLPNHAGLSTAELATLRNWIVSGQAQ